VRADAEEAGLQRPRDGAGGGGGQNTTLEHGLRELVRGLGPAHPALWPEMDVPFGRDLTRSKTRPRSCAPRRRRRAWLLPAERFIKGSDIAFSIFARTVDDDCRSDPLRCGGAAGRCPSSGGQRAAPRKPGEGHARSRRAWTTLTGQAAGRGGYDEIHRGSVLRARRVNVRTINRRRTRRRQASRRRRPARRVTGSVTRRNVERRPAKRAMEPNERPTSAAAGTMEVCVDDDDCRRWPWPDTIVSQRRSSTARTRRTSSAPSR